MVFGQLVGFLALFCACVAQSPQSTCRDLDAHACTLFATVKPDLCNDPTIAQTTCRRFCGNCPLECYACPTPMLNPLDCNTTTTCATGQTCVTKHLAVSGHHEYILACEQKEICLGQYFGFGKRETEPDRYRRDVSVVFAAVCCETDFCNSPFSLITTTLPPTSSVTITPTSSVTISPTSTVTIPPTSSGPFPHALECYSCPTPILNPLDCNTTTTCATGQTCVTKHLTALDGHHEYIVSCDSKAVCQGLNFGFGGLIGKREDSDAEPEAGRYRRDVTNACCDTDFCNTPYSLTTTILPPTSSGPFPHGCDRDIVFVVDDSGSVGATNFRQALGFIKEIVHQLTIGPTKAQTGLVTFSTHAYPMWHLNEIMTEQQLLRNLSYVPYMGGIARTNEALNLVRTTMLTAQHGDRPNNKNVVIVMTDGDSTDKQATIREANMLRSVSDDVISVVIGQGINIQELMAIATDSHHVFDVHSYSSLQSILSQLMQIICNA